jgi:hypothetical protein
LSDRLTKSKASLYYIATMKNLITVLSFLFVLVSCQKEYTAERSTENPGTVNTTGSFKAKINSVQWSGDKSAGAVFTTAGNGLPALINISGLGDDKKAIIITIVDSGVHRYTINNDSWQYAAYLDSTLPVINPYTTVLVDDEIAGIVDITSINTVAKTISGTFSFKASRDSDNAEINITEGSFTDIPYKDGAILPPSVAADTFHVKIDGTLFTPYAISGNAILSNHTIMVQGSDSAALKTVALTMPDNITPGSYSMDGITYYGLYNNGDSSLGPVSGTLEILEHNTSTKRIRGKFDYKAESPVDPNIAASLTEGYFSVVYK